MKIQKGCGIGQILLFAGLGISGYAFTATPLNEGNLRDESDALERVTPPVVQAVEQDVNKPVPVQEGLNRQIAKKHTGVLNQDNLDASVLSEHEEQKKVNEPVRVGAYHQQHIPKLLPYDTKLYVEKLNFSGPQLGNAKGDVTITINK